MMCSRMGSHLMGDCLLFAAFAAIASLSACGDDQRTGDPMAALVTGDSPTKGTAPTWVTIVEFGDFQCPYCGAAAQTMRSLLAHYGDGDVSLTFKHLPLSFHENAYPAAVSAECAHAQGQFWPMHDEQYSHQSALDATSRRGYAADIGLDLNAYDDCMLSMDPRNRVDRDVSAADEAAIDGTPSFFINGELVVGAYPLADFISIVDDKLAEAQASGVSREAYYQQEVLGQ